LQNSFPYLFPVFAFISFAIPVLHREDEEDKGKKALPLSHSLEAGFSIGGQLSNDNFVYETGKLVQYTSLCTS
jgi:hypothetical protein